MKAHENLLEEAVRNSSECACRLKSKSILVTGASGFLASSLLIFLERLDRRFGLKLDLHATARRPPHQVGLFRFLEVSPPNWVVSSVEDTILRRVPESCGSHSIVWISQGLPAGTHGDL